MTWLHSLTANLTIIQSRLKMAAGRRTSHTRVLIALLDEGFLCWEPPVQTSRAKRAIYRVKQQSDPSLSRALLNYSVVFRNVGSRLPQTAQAVEQVISLNSLLVLDLLCLLPCSLCSREGSASSWSNHLKRERPGANRHKHVAANHPCAAYTRDARHVASIAIHNHACFQQLSNTPSARVLDPVSQSRTIISSTA